MNLQARVVQALALLLAVGVVARVVWTLLEPLLAPLIALVFVGSLLVWLLRGPRAR